MQSDRNFDQFLKEIIFYEKMFQYFGVHFFDLKRFKQKKIECPSKFQFLHMLVQVIVVILLAGYYAYKSFLNKYESENILMNAIMFAMNFGLLVVLFVGTLQLFVSSKRLKKVFWLIREMFIIIDYNFTSQFDVNAFNRRIRNITVTIYIGFSASYVIVDDYDLLMNNIIFSFIPLFLIMTIVLSYAFYLSLINQMIHFVSTNIEKIFEINEEMNFMNYRRIIVSSKFLQRPYENLKKLKACRQIYNIITECGNLINESFGLTVLLLLIFSITHLSILGYKILTCMVEARFLEISLGEFRSLICFSSRIR